MNYNDAIAQARNLSIDDAGSVMVNQRADGSFYTSDWYGADRTIAMYEKGVEKWTLFGNLSLRISEAITMLREVMRDDGFEWSKIIIENASAPDDLAVTAYDSDEEHYKYASYISGDSVDVDAY